MNVQSYLNRIGYQGSKAPNLDTLKKLMRTHLLTVPFENISIHIGERILLDHEWLYEKIVERNRGGFCYELNGLFSWLLQQMGYQVEMLSAGVRSNDMQPYNYGPDFDHMVLKVDLDEPWLVDVGFGRSFLEPLSFDLDKIQNQGNEKYRITSEEDYRIYWRYNETWVPDYKFSLTPYPLEAFKKMCHYHQTSSKSSFTRKWFATQLTKNGRSTLSQEEKDFRFISTSTGRRHEVVIQGIDNVSVLLEDVFGIPESTFDRPGRRKKQRKNKAK